MEKNTKNITKKWVQYFALTWKNELSNLLVRVIIEWRSLIKIFATPAGDRDRSRRSKITVRFSRLNYITENSSVIACLSHFQCQNF